LIGELRIIFQTMDEMPTQPMNAFDETTEVLNRKDAPFHISLQPPPISIPPGAHASAELTIANITDERGYYMVDVAGVPRSWVRLDRPRVLLEPHESGQVVIQVRPVRQPDTAPGDYIITVTVREEDHPDNIVEGSTRLHILPYGGFGMALEREQIESGERFRLHLHNQGSADLPLTVKGGPRTDDVAIEFVSSPQVTLGPGQRLVIQGKVTPKRNKMLGSAETYPFDIEVRSGEANQFVAVTTGKLLSRAMFPTWVPYVAGLLILGVIGFAALVVGVLLAPSPSVTDFRVGATAVQRGGILDVFWDADDVNELELLVDGTPFVMLTPSVGVASVDTAFFEGNTVLQLRGNTGRREAISSEQLVQVMEPMALLSFEATPNQLVRHVVTSLDLVFEVENAEFVTIGGLEDFSRSAVEPGTRYDPVDSIEGVTGIAQGNLTVEIFAEDAIGTVFTDTLVIETIPAQCTATDEAVRLLDGPNALNQQISTVPTGEPVNVVGQDQSGAWLAVALGNDLTGWGALDALDCADTFNPAELAIIVDVTPPPVPNPQGTPPPTLPAVGGPPPTETATPGPIVTEDAIESLAPPQPTATSSG
ncbi:MAG: SH3 domain-containing protein, partial [Chloroflexota bacterium]